MTPSPTTSPYPRVPARFSRLEPTGGERQLVWAAGTSERLVLAAAASLVGDA